MPTAESVRRYASPLVLGAVSVAGFAPLGWFPLVVLTLGSLYALLGRLADDRRTLREAALTGWFFGLGFFLVGVSWIFVSLSTFGGMPAPVAALATLLFCAAMALYPALVATLFVRLAPPHGVRRALVFAALWAISEWLRGWVLTGFPWLAVGYSQTPPSPLAGYAPLLGVYGVSLLTAFVGAVFADDVLTRRRTPARLFALGAAIFLVLAGAALSGRAWTEPQGEPLSVALLQGNVAQDLKWRPEQLDESMRIYYQLLQDHPAQLTVLPETALPTVLSQLPGGYLEAMQRLATRRNGDLLFGIVTGDRTSYANSVIALESGDRPGMQQYDKNHLVPFGEFVPPGFAWFMRLADIPMSDFTPGSQQQSPFHFGDQRVAVNICYEDAFGEEIIGALPEATLLINVSNVAWFGDSLAPAQHLQIARLRALETGRMILRATNTGMTAIVGADGNVQAVLPPFTRAALTGKIQGYTGSTPYVRWGNGPAVILALLLLAFARWRNALS